LILGGIAKHFKRQTGYIVSRSLLVSKTKSAIEFPEILNADQDISFIDSAHSLSEN